MSNFVFVLLYDCSWISNGLILVWKGMSLNIHISIIYMPYINHISIKIYGI